MYLPICHLCETIIHLAILFNIEMIMLYIPCEKVFNSSPKCVPCSHFCLVHIDLYNLNKTLNMEKCQSRKYVELGALSLDFFKLSLNLI